MISDNKWEYHVNDPELMIMENGRLRPVRYQVMYQQICTGVNSVGKRTYKHLWELKYFGGLYAAPVGEASETGIIKYTSSAGA
jgi:hypothetical protein